MLSTLLLLPSWPPSFAPHVHTVPFPRKATQWLSPAAIATTSLNPVTRTAARRCVFVPSPSRPSCPDDHTVPISPQRDAVPPSAIDGDDVEERSLRSTTDDEHRNRPVLVGAIAQLTQTVQTPGPHGAIGPHGQAVHELKRPPPARGRQTGASASVIWSSPSTGAERRGPDVRVPVAPPSCRPTSRRCRRVFSKLPPSARLCFPPPGSMCRRTVPSGRATVSRSAPFEDDEVTDPVPSWPDSAAPQANVGSNHCCSSRLWIAPAAIDRNPWSDCGCSIRTGLLRLPSSPRPRRPALPAPHDHTDPSTRKARLWALPAATATAPRQILRTSRRRRHPAPSPGERRSDRSSCRLRAGRPGFDPRHRRRRPTPGPSCDRRRRRSLWKLSAPFPDPPTGTGVDWSTVLPSPS